MCLLPNSEAAALSTPKAAAADVWTLPAVLLRGLERPSPESGRLRCSTVLSGSAAGRSCMQPVLRLLQHLSSTHYTPCLHAFAHNLSTVQVLHRSAGCCGLMHAE